jgi:hypothetical protein
VTALAVAFSETGCFELSHAERKLEVHRGHVSNPLYLIRDLLDHHARRLQPIGGYGATFGRQRGCPQSLWGRWAGPPAGPGSAPCQNPRAASAHELHQTKDKRRGLAGVPKNSDCDRCGIGTPVSEKKIWAARSGNLTSAAISPHSSKSGTPIRISVSLNTDYLFRLRNRNVDCVSGLLAYGVVVGIG